MIDPFSSAWFAAVKPLRSNTGRAERRLGRPEQESCHAGAFAMVQQSRRSMDQRRDDKMDVTVRGTEKGRLAGGNAVDWDLDLRMI